jgi:hypothetical protein
MKCPAFPMSLLRRLFLEPLEARIAPATLIWDGSAGNGDWFTPANWDGNVVPGPADTAVLDIASTINLTANATVGAFVLSSGTLTGAGTLTVSGNLMWTGGSMEGSGQTSVAGAGSTISGFGPMRLSRELVNSGTLTYSSGDAVAGLQFGVAVGAPGTLVNTATGTVTVTAGGDFTAFFSDPGHRIQNAGTWNISGGNVQSVVGASVGFDNTGTVNVSNATASFMGGGTSTGAWTVAAKRTLGFAGGTHVFNAGSAFTGAGTVEISAGVFHLHAGTYNVTGTTQIDGGEARFDAAATTTTLNVTGGTQSGSGTLTVTGNLGWSGGTLAGTGTTVVNGPISGVGGPAVKFLSRRLENTGILSFVSTDNSGPVQFMGGGAAPGRIVNLAGGTVVVNSGGDFTVSGPTAVHAIINHGTWNVTGPSVTSTVAAGIAFTNTGTSMRRPAPLDSKAAIRRARAAPSSWAARLPPCPA